MRFSKEGKQPAVVQELRTKLHVMLDKRRPSKTNVIGFKQASDRSQDAIFLEEYQALVGAVTDYFFIPDEKVDYEHYHSLKERIGSLQESVKEKRRKGGGPKVGENAGDFIDISSRTRVAGIQKLSQNQLEQAYMATQQLEAEVEAQSQAAISDLSEKANMDPDEVKTEKELALQAKLPFNKEKKLLSQLKTDLENTLRARQSSTPTMTR